MRKQSVTYKVSAVILSLLLLIVGTSFSIYKHECKSEHLISWGINLLENDSCCNGSCHLTAFENTTDHCDDMADCCQHVYILHLAKETIAQSINFQFNSAKAIWFFDFNFQNFIELTESFEFSTYFNFRLRPKPDLQTLFQVFII